MSTGHGLAVTRRRLRAELRRRREQAGLSLEQVAREMVWSVSKVVRIESGAVGISVNDARALLELYGAADAGDVDRILRLAQETRQPTWWSRYRDHLSSTYADFISFEADATRMTHFHPSVVPGLLQTEEYAEAVDPMFSPADAARIHIEVRMQRQQRLFERPEPPEYVAILDEAVLRRPVGGPAVMRTQLKRLLDAADEPFVTLVVVPIDAGAHPGLVMGGFVLLEFGDPDDSDVAMSDNFNSAFLTDAPAEVAFYRRAIDRLLEQGLAGRDAVDLIRRLYERLD